MNKQICKMKKSIISFFLIVFIVACSSPLIEVVEETYPDGNPKVIKFYSEETGTRELVKEIVYYENKQKQSEGEFKNNKMSGKWTYWYDNGNKWAEGYYINQIEHGLKTIWHRNGQKYYEGKFENGKRIGVWNFWDETGKLVKSVDYDS